jgi:hypothetical protein
VAHTFRIMECMWPLGTVVAAYMPESGTYAPPTAGSIADKSLGTVPKRRRGVYTPGENCPGEALVISPNRSTKLVTKEQACPGNSLKASQYSCCCSRW